MGVYAVIDTDTVTNLVVCDDTAHADEQGWTCVDGLDPQPGIGWGYDGTTFTAPVTDRLPPLPLTVQVDPDVLCDVLEQVDGATNIATLKAAVSALVQSLGGSA